MAEIDLIAPPKTVTFSVALEPVYNALDSIQTLNIAEQFPGLDQWVVQTAATLPPERLRANKLVLGPLFDATVPEHRDWPGFPAYLDDLAAGDPYAMRDRVLDMVCRKEELVGAKPDPRMLLADVQSYLAQVESSYRSKDKSEHFDRSQYEEVHALLNDPPAMMQLIVAHMRAMWEEVMAPEWARVEPMLRESVAAFQKLDFSGLSTAETFRTITGRPLPEEWEECTGNAEHVVCIPSAHIGPYLSMSFKDEVARVSFGARIPKGVQVSSPALSRSELLVRLNALADDTRLHILRLLSENDELCAQDIIERLDLSQSAASRHLRHLTATGYVTERRRDGAKCYSLNRERIDDTYRALAQLLG